MNPPGLSLVYLNSKEAIPGLKVELDIGGNEFQVDSINSKKVKKICLELMGVNIQILTWADREAMLKINGLSVQFAEQDFLDRINPDKVNPGKAIEYDTNNILKPHLYPKSGRLSYTYSERMNPELTMIIKTLKEKPNTRQAFLSIWHPKSDGRFLERKRVPCSIGYHFLLRNGELTMLYQMRSLEISTCFGYDIYTSSRLLEYVAEQIGAKVGFLHFFIGSLHKFEEIGGDKE